jgi:hypothetical protein
MMTWKSFVEGFRTFAVRLLKFDIFAAIMLENKKRER